MSITAEVITAVAGGGGFLVPAGGAIAFVWNKIERRAVVREKANEARFTKIEQDLAECRRREVESQERRAIQLTVIELLWAKVKELDPSAHVLDRAKHLLDELKQKSGPGAG